MYDAKENNDVESVICNTHDTQPDNTYNNDISLPVQTRSKAVSRLRKDKGTLHAPRHSILSRPLLQGLARRGESIRQLKQIERILRDELQPRGVIGELLMDWVWFSYLRCVAS
jgi:hypothetical protein